VLAHIGLPKAIALAEKLEGEGVGVDFVLSSDTHERTYEPIVRGKTWIVEPGGFGSFVGRLDLTLEHGKIVDRSWKLIETRADRVAEDPAVKAVVETTLAPLRSRLDREIGATDVPLIRYNVVETNLDAMLADALREAGGTQIALSNGFRFAGPTPAGPIREKDLWDWYPINARLRTGIVTGKQLRDFWERELEHVFATDPEKMFGGWVPRPSGMTVRFEAHAPRGRRVEEIRVGGRPIRDEERYTIASCEREGDPPDRVCRISDVADIRNLDIDAHQAVREYLERHRPIERPEMDRVVATDLPDVVRSQVFAP
jgi:2',3'-cyclic-nucleotide 2'-phosphodiesterase (5'-nucleotidase family)